MTTPTPERRTHARHAINFSVRFQNLKSGETSLDDEAELAGTDLSLGGLGVAGVLQMPPGTKMMLKLKFEDDEEELLVPAKVMWTRSPGGAVHQSGIKFVYLSDEGNLRIQKFVVKASLFDANRF